MRRSAASLCRAKLLDKKIKVRMAMDDDSSAYLSFAWLGRRVEFEVVPRHGITF